MTAFLIPPPPLLILQRAQSSFTFCTHFYLLGLASDSRLRYLIPLPSARVPSPSSSYSFSFMGQLWETVGPSFPANELHNKQLPRVLHFLLFSFISPGTHSTLSTWELQTFSFIIIVVGSAPGCCIICQLKRSPSRVRFGLPHVPNFWSMK